MTKIEKLQPYFDAMMNKHGAKVKGDYANAIYLINSINLDGECDLYSIQYGEIIYFNEPAKNITLTSYKLKP